VPSPWDPNLNPGHDLPEWRRFGFESDAAYQEALLVERIREQQRPGRLVPPPQDVPDGPNYLNRFFGNPEALPDGDQRRERLIDD